LWPKNYTLELSFIVYQFFSLGCIKTLWGDAPSLVPFQRIYRRWNGRYIESFGSYVLPTDGRSAERRRNL